MIYELRHFDKTVLKFSAVDNSNETDIRIVRTADDKSLLSLDLKLTDDGVYKWLKHRTIPSNRLSSGDNHMFDGAKFSYDGDFLGYLGLEGCGIFTNHDSDVMQKITEMANSL